MGEGQELESEFFPGRDSKKGERVSGGGNVKIQKHKL